MCACDLGVYVALCALCNLDSLRESPAVPEDAFRSGPQSTPLPVTVENQTRGQEKQNRTCIRAAAGSSWPDPTQPGHGISLRQFCVPNQCCTRTGPASAYAPSEGPSHSTGTQVPGRLPASAPYYYVGIGGRRTTAAPAPGSIYLTLSWWSRR